MMDNMHFIQIVDNNNIPIIIGVGEGCGGEGVVGAGVVGEGVKVG